MPQADNRTVAYPEGGTSRTLTGPEGTRGLTGAGRAGGERSQERASQAEATSHTKSKDEQSNRGRDNHNNQRPTGTRNTTKTPQRKHTDQKTPDTKGQPEQAEANNRPQDTGPTHHPEKDNGQGRPFFLARARCLSASLRGPAGNRTTTGSLSAPSRTTLYQLNEDTQRTRKTPRRQKANQSTAKTGSQKKHDNEKK